MKRILISAVALVLTLATAGLAFAQHHPAPSPGGGPGPGMMGAGMMGGQGMCPMMMGGPMGGMREGGDRAASPQMLQMRGEMMKAMGEILMKHGKAMESQPR